MIRHPGHGVLLAAVIIICWTVDLTWEYSQLTNMIKMSPTLHTMCPSRLSPDVVSPGSGVLPQELLRGVEGGLSLAHGQVRLLARGEFISYLAVVLRLEPGKMSVRESH